MACCYLEFTVALAGKKDTTGKIDKEPLLQYDSIEQGRKLKCVIPTPARIYFHLCRLWHRLYCILTQKRVVRTCRRIAVMISFIALLVALVVFVGFPVMFMNSIQLQRDMIFEPTTQNHSFYEQRLRLRYNNFYPLYEYNGKPGNIYVNVNKTHNISLGVWHLLPYLYEHHFELRKTDTNNSLSLMNISKPVVLYFHEGKGDRSFQVDTCHYLAIFFHVIAFDYRSYGDSSTAELTEEGIVQDSVALYKWLRTQATSDIYIWGEKLGAAIATETVAKLRKENIIPKGLILENAFTTFADKIKSNWVFSWLPWLKATMLDPLEKNGYLFETSEHILNVDCRIMIIHWYHSDIPYALGEKLFETAKKFRNKHTQGNVTFHLVPWHYRVENMYKEMLPTYFHDIFPGCPLEINRHCIIK